MEKLLDAALLGVVSLMWAASASGALTLWAMQWPFLIRRNKNG